MADKMKNGHTETSNAPLRPTAYCENSGHHQPGLRQENIVKYYSEWANQYDADLCPENYPGPEVCCNAVCECFPSDKEKEGAEILDVACGTGLLGDLLHKQGFRNVDGIDPADNMVTVAIQKNCYRKIYCEFLNSNSTIEKGAYDCVAVVGGFAEGHLPCQSLYSMVHVVKPGGYVVIALREAYLHEVEEYIDRLEPLMKQIEEEGKWKMESRTIIPRYSFNNKGLLFKFKVC